MKEHFRLTQNQFKQLRKYDIAFYYMWRKVNELTYIYCPFKQIRTFIQTITNN